MSNEVKKNYTNQELNAMSNDELARLGTELDDVTVAFRKERFPVANDPAEKRAARAVTIWVLIGIIAAIAAGSFSTRQTASRGAANARSPSTFIAPPR